MAAAAAVMASEQNSQDMEDTAARTTSRTTKRARARTWSFLFFLPPPAEAVAERDVADAGQGQVEEEEETPPTKTGNNCGTSAGRRAERRSRTWNMRCGHLQQTRDVTGCQASAIGAASVVSAGSAGLDILAQAGPVRSSDRSLEPVQISTLPGSVVESLQEEKPPAGSQDLPQSSTKLPPPNKSRSWRYLALVTAAHMLFNFGNDGDMAIPGFIWRAVRQQAGGGEHVHSWLMVADAAGSLVGLVAGGLAMDRFPAHLVAFYAACGSALNIALLPDKQGLLAVLVSNLVLYFGVGVVNCSYAALIWAAAESGVTRSGPHLVVKGLGSRLGYVTAALIATWTATSDTAGGWVHGNIARPTLNAENDSDGSDYSVLAYTFSVLCALGGVALAVLPSPYPRRVEALDSAKRSPRPNHSGAGTAVSSCAWKERFVLLVGALFLMMETALQVAAMSLLADSVSAETAHDVLVFYYALSVLASVAAVFLAGALPPAAALAIHLLVGTGGCAGMAALFAAGAGDAALLWASFGFLSALAPVFSLTFAWVASITEVSGGCSAALSCGASFGPLVSAALLSATGGSVALGVVFTAAVLASIAGALVLQMGIAAPLRKVGFN